MLTDAVLLDISQAQRQIDQLETELKRLSQPVKVPVDIEGGQAADELRRDFQGADAGVAELNAELAETDRELDQIRSSADRAGRELDQAGRKGAAGFNGMAVAAGAFGVALGAAVGIRAFVGFANDAIQAASSFEEALSKTNVVFGDFSDEIVKFAETGPQALGLATREALAFTSTFGNLFVALGLSQEAAAELSPEIVQLGADLASFNDIDVAEALEKLRSGLVGEAEPLRSLGVNINEAVVQAKALELGLTGVNGELTEAAKVQARYALIVEQTATAQGDFARTADGVANRQRSISAGFRDLQVAIGQALIPAFESLLDAAPALIGAIEGLIPVFANLANSIAGLDASGIGDFVQIMTAVPTVFDTAGTAVTGFADLVVGSLQSLTDFGGGSDRAAAGVNRFSNAIDQFNLAGLRNGLINALQEGRDPALALADALVELSDKGLSLGDFADAANQLTSIANLDTGRLADITRHFQEQGRMAGLDADEIFALRQQFLLLINEQEDFKRRQPGGGPPSPSTDIFQIIDDFTTGLSGIDDAVLAANAAAAGLDLQPILDAATDGAQAFVDLADTGTAAAEALRTEEDEMIEDLSGFLNDFAAELESRNAFQDNLTLLRALGFGDLAQVFEDAGLDAAQALVEAVHNPEKAAEGERLAEENARGQARKFDDAFRAELAALILAQPVDIQLGTIQLGEIQGVLNIGPIGGGQGVGNILAGTGSVTVTQVFPTIPAPNVASDAIKQAVGTIARNTPRTGPQ